MEATWCPYSFCSPSVQTCFMKDQATILFRRKADGNVVGEVVDSSGKVVSSKEFGNLSDAEIDRIIQAFQAENPEVDVLPTIAVIGN